MEKLLSFVLLLLPSPLLGAPLVIDDFYYPDDIAAQSTWHEMTGALPVQMSDSGEWGDERVMQLPLNFTTLEDRAYWDRDVALDLSAYSDFALEIFVPEPVAVSHFTLFFRSGSGWYGQGVNVSTPGWQTMYFSAFDFTIEGSPDGWDQIDGIRLSPWKESPVDSYLAVRELRAFTPDILVVLDTHGADTRTAENTAGLLKDWLARFNVAVGVISDDAAEAGHLAGAKMVILPFNDSLSDTALGELESYVGDGGKLMVYYVLEDRIADLLGIQRTGWTQGDFAAYTFDDDIIQHLPASVAQASWNITIAEPAGQYNARVIAEWQDDQGVATGHPAWLASDKGLFMSHIMLSDDAETKQYMLLVLLGHYVPEIWPLAAAAAIENIGEIADYLTYDEAVADIGLLGAQTPRAAQVEEELAQADALRDQALAELDDGQYPQAIPSAADARRHLLEAYYLCQSPVWPEFRAVWEHSGTGPYPGDWSASIAALADNNFTAVFPNMLWGGVAHYDSDLLPHSDVFTTHGDQIDACLAAAHQRGIEVHVWKVNFNLSRAPQWFIDDMRAAGRTQVTRYGEEVDWLCPSHPDNLVLERDSMLEVVENYDVDGIHFDYIRYPGRDHCYCDGCRTRFEQQTGNTVLEWPADVVDGGSLEEEFLDWRRQQITNLVAAVYQGVQATRPEVQVSAAVFSSYAYCRDGVGQDWVSWIDQGIVDFLCPMDYTNDFDRFENLVNEQLDYAAERVPVYPGIGASSSSSSFGPDGVIVQVKTSRELETGGFIIFNFDRDLAVEDLPALGKGTTFASSTEDGGDGGPDGGADAGQDAGSDAGPDGSDTGSDSSTEEPGTDAGIPDGGDSAADSSPGADESGEIGGGCGCGRQPSGTGLVLIFLFITALALVRRQR